MARSFLQLFCAVVAAGCTLLLCTSGRAVAADGDGFVSIFDGKSLDGWEGNPKLWSVRDGAITGQTTAENPTKGNTFLIWRGGEVGDFELVLEYKIIGHNSGVQYRSKPFEGENDWVIGGYQADIEAGDTYSGINYDERGRGIIAQRGQQTVVRDDHKPQVVGQLRDSKELQSHIKKEDWNEYRIIASGYTFIHAINGYVTSIVTDEDEQEREAKGLLALQLHAGPPMTVQFRNIRLKQLDGDNDEPADDKVSGRLVPGRRVSGPARRSDKNQSSTSQPDTRHQTPDIKKIVFIAGRQSHGYGAHEHKAGCMLLQRELEASGLPLETMLVTNGWPKDESVLDDADCVVIYADGGGGHPAVAHLDVLKKLEDRGVGIVCLHYGVEVPKGEAGDAFLDAIGGYFEPHWSVNPHWTADYEKLPQHQITRGVKPFQVNDEWYYHMRFRDGMQGVTPILTDVPPPESLSRPDGPHEGNPAVREAIAKKEPQHMAWAYERPNGGRGFGFTGAHFHWNWGNNDFRKLVLNAIVWSAGLDVPKDGVTVHDLSVADLEANQDEDKPADYNPARVAAMLKEWNR